MKRDRAELVLNGHPINHSTKVGGLIVFKYIWDSHSAIVFRQCRESTESRPSDAESWHPRCFRTTSHDAYALCGVLEHHGKCSSKTSGVPRFTIAGLGRL